MDYENVLGESKFPTYEQLKSGLIRLIEEGKITREDAGMLLPELRESEDERIRKELIEFIKWSVDRHFMREDFHQAKRPSEWIAYLEKQNHDGKKWITPAKLNRLETLRYEAGYKAGFNVGVHSEAEKQKEQKSRDYCSVRDEFDLDGNLKQKDHFRDDTKMVEKQDYSSLNDLERAIHRGFLSAGVENAPVTLIKETAKECLEQMKPSEINIRALLSADRLASAEMTGRLKERSEILENPEEYGLHKPSEWSDEDEEIVRFYEMDYNNKVGDWPNKDVVEMRLKFKDWLLNRLKFIRPQPKQEWSEEDEQWLESIIREYEGRIYTDKAQAAITQIKIDFLKSLRPQPHWKPSERMLKALKWAKCEFHPDCPETMEQLNYLYTELKKIYYDGN